MAKWGGGRRGKEGGKGEVEAHTGGAVAGEGKEGCCRAAPGDYGACFFRVIIIFLLLLFRAAAGGGGCVFGESVGLSGIGGLWGSFWGCYSSCLFSFLLLLSLSFFNLFLFCSMIVLSIIIILVLYHAFSQLSRSGIVAVHAHAIHQQLFSSSFMSAILVHSPHLGKGIFVSGGT